MIWSRRMSDCGLINITPDGKFVPDAAESGRSSPDVSCTRSGSGRTFLFHGTQVDAAVVKFNIDRIMEPRDQVQHADVLRSRCTRSRCSIRICCRSDEASLRVHDAHAGRVPVGVVLLLSHRKRRSTSLEDREGRKAGGGRGMRAFQARRVVKGGPSGHGPLRQVLRAGLPYVIASYPCDQGSRHADGAFKASDRLIADFSPITSTLRAAEPTRPDHDRKETTPMMAMMKYRARGREPIQGRRRIRSFNDLRVRKAIGCYGIDRKEIVKIAFRDRPRRGLGILPPGTLDATDVTHLCPYDPVRAKALLAEAGYGPQKPLTFEL